MAPPIIVLTTDFGASSPAVGVMKGVILTINPRATVVDLTHQIDPQNVLQGARTLGGSHRFFPREAIHVAVVDPGVGTSRQALLLTTPHGRFVGPDNGLFSGVIRGYLPEIPNASGLVPVPQGCSARALTQPRYWLDPVSNTFHGRDVFSPVAAHLSLGVPDQDMGSSLETIEYLAAPQPSISTSGQRAEIRGEVVSADHFGNLVTNITAQDLGQARGITIEIKGCMITGLSKTFHDEGPDPEAMLVALISSSGHLEIAVRDGNAAEYLSAGVGDTVTAQTANPS
jgi:S-adenosylmethionine hydrolase